MSTLDCFAALLSFIFSPMDLNQRVNFSGGLAEDWTESHSCRSTEHDFNEISLSLAWQSVTLLNCVHLDQPFLSVARGAWIRNGWSRAYMAVLEHHVRLETQFKCVNLHVGNITGNPGVFQGNPHPYPWIPVSVHKGSCFGGCGCGCGCGLAKNPWV